MLPDELLMYIARFLKPMPLSPTIRLPILTFVKVAGQVNLRMLSLSPFIEYPVLYQPGKHSPSRLSKKEYIKQWVKNDIKATNLMEYREDPGNEVGFTPLISWLLGNTLSVPPTLPLLERILNKFFIMSPLLPQISCTSSFTDIVGKFLSRRILKVHFFRRQMLSSLRPVSN